MTVSGRPVRVRTVEPRSLARWRRELAEQQPASEERVPLTPAVKAAFECGHCLSDVVIPRVIRLHDPTCPTLRR